MRQSPSALARDDSQLHRKHGGNPSSCSCKNWRLQVQSLARLWRDQLVRFIDRDQFNKCTPKVHWIEADSHADRNHYKDDASVWSGH